MFGARSFATSTFAGISQVTPQKAIFVSALSITTVVQDPVVFTDEIVQDLTLQVSLQSPTINTTPNDIVVKINEVDISNQVRWESLRVSSQLWSDPDTATFEILAPEKKSYTPSAGDEVEITVTGRTIFKGLLTFINKGVEGYAELYSLEFKDWTEELGNIIIDLEYSNTTVADIIADIFTDTDLSEYDGTTNVTATTTINRIVFDNISVVEALDRLADYTGQKWYVSPDKEIYFFSGSGISAPFNISDTAGNHYDKSLLYDEDYTQIRNRVTVKGRDVPAVTVEDATSQSTYGLREYFERDNDLNATNEVTQKANAILSAYKDPIKKASFETIELGLFAGQQIDIVSERRGINETLNIEEVIFQSVYPNRFISRVRCSNQRVRGIEDLFKDQVDEREETPGIDEQDKINDVEFSAIDDDTIEWSAGTIRMADGTTYSISAQASQDLTGDHIIYFDKNISETELQISTNFADGIGIGKIPMAYATKSDVATKGADIFPVMFGQKMQIDGGVHITDRSIIAENIAANSITANEISANTITANEIASGTITADEIASGTITADEIAGGTITADEISANTITANEITTSEFITLSAQIKDGIITNAKIESLTADKLTAGTIDASVITVENINADNITTGILEGRTIKANGGVNGSDVWMNNDGRLRFRYDNDDVGGIQMFAGGHCYFKANNELSLVYNDDGGPNNFYVWNDDQVVLQIDDDNDAYFNRDIIAGRNIRCGDTFESSDGSDGINATFGYTDENGAKQCMQFKDGILVRQGGSSFC